MSQQIKALEVRHGSTLFDGRKRPLQLTLLGRELFGLTKRMFSTSQDIEDLLGTPRDASIAPIRIAADSPIYAVRLAQRLQRDTPEGDVDVHICNGSDTLQRLHDAHADVAIVSDPQIDPRFVYQPLFIDYLKVVVPVDHPLAGAKQFPLARFAEETLLLREVSSKTRMAVMSLLRLHDITPARQIILDSREAIREAVALGMGVSLLFSSECPPDARLLAMVPESQPDSSLLTGYLAFHTDRRRSSMIRRIIAAATDLKSLSPISLPPKDC